MNLFYSAFIIFIFKTLIFTDFYNVLFGPFEINKSVLLTNPGSGIGLEYKLHNGVVSMKGNIFSDYKYFIGKKYYFKINDSDFQDLGVQDVFTYRSNRSYSVEKKYITGEYLITKVKDKFLIVKVKKGLYKKNSYAGFLVDLEYYETSNIIRESRLNIDNKNVLPFIFDSTISIGYGTYIKFLTFLILAGINLFIYYRYIRTLFNYKKHKIYSWLSRYGDPDEVIEKIQLEIDSVPAPYKKKVTTTTWTFQKEWLGLEIERHPVKNEPVIDGMQYIKRRGL